MTFTRAVDSIYGPNTFVWASHEQPCHGAAFCEGVLQRSIPLASSKSAVQLLMQPLSAHNSEAMVSTDNAAELTCQSPCKTALDGDTCCKPDALCGSIQTIAAVCTAGNGLVSNAGGLACNSDVCTAEDDEDTCFLMRPAPLHRRACARRASSTTLPVCFALQQHVEGSR